MTKVKAEITPVGLTSAEHYRWGAGSEGWRLLSLPVLSVIQERVPPGTGETLHFHTQAHQFFYVLRGTATLECDEKQIEFSAGQGVHVPNGVSHRFANNTDCDVDFLVISTALTAHDRTNVE